MTEGIRGILSWAIKLAFVMAGVFAFIVVLNMGASLLRVALNGNIVSDILAMIQMWMPFNLNSLLAWITTSVTIYFTYRLTVAAIIWLERFLGAN